MYESHNIIHYLTNELSPADREAFEAELDRDPGLAAETARYREMLGVLEDRLPEDKPGNALKSTLDGMREKYFGTASRGRVVDFPAAKRPVMIQRSTVRIISGIAAILVLVVAGLWVLRDNQSTLDKLGQTEMVTSLQRGGPSDTVLETAAERFNAGRFGEALPLLDMAVTADSSSQLARFYRGVTLWQLKRLPASRADLEAVYTGGSALQSEAAFYLALTYAQDKNTPTALFWLNRIPDDSPVASKANKLRHILKPAQ